MVCSALACRRSSRPRVDANSQSNGAAIKLALRCRRSVATETAQGCVMWNNDDGWPKEFAGSDRSKLPKQLGNRRFGRCLLLGEFPEALMETELLSEEFAARAKDNRQVHMACSALACRRGSRPNWCCVALEPRQQTDSPLSVAVGVWAT